jgi:hypothetical protein
MMEAAGLRKEVIISNCPGDFGEAKDMMNPYPTTRAFRISLSPGERADLTRPPPVA